MTEQASKESSHYAGCWGQPGHHACAFAEIARLEKSLGRIARKAKTQSREFTAQIARDAIKGRVLPEDSEIARLTRIVREWVDVHSVRAGYDCPDCGTQVAFGDGVCRVTGKDHPEPIKHPVCETCGGKGVIVTAESASRPETPARSGE